MRDTATAIVNVGISNILYACTRIGKVDGYTYHFATSIDELKVQVYRRRPGFSVRSRLLSKVIDLNDADVMEDLNALEEKLLAISRKASV